MGEAHGRARKFPNAVPVKQRKPKAAGANKQGRGRVSPPRRGKQAERATGIESWRTVKNEVRKKGARKSNCKEKRYH